ncbi:META domain-containing protein [Nitriliruptor alkaliphilus]|uniref:META domain-containing protein n=1 Tax=Nitriliruptor alkaliphilus TaxID=427918 RepID=UPI001B80840A|nr:META domain-containing protein [Nitriliruptor alkaliphilus]
MDRPTAPRDDTEQDLRAHGEPTEDQPPAPAPTPTPEPSPPPRTEEPRATPDADRSPAPHDHGARLWGRWFRADEIREGDVRVLVAGDHPLYVGFLRQDGGDGLVWMTSCNTFGGELTVGRERLRVRDIGGTAVACEDDNQHDQEEWLEAFFAAGPRWLTAGDQLRMWTPDGRRIDLFEAPEGPGPPWS